MLAPSTGPGRPRNRAPGPLVSPRVQDRVTVQAKHLQLLRELASRSLAFTGSGALVSVPAGFDRDEVERALTDPEIDVTESLASTDGQIVDRALADEAAVGEAAQARAAARLGAVPVGRLRPGEGR